MFAFFKKILRLVKPYKVRFVGGILCGFLSGLASPLLMVAVKLAVDTLFGTGPTSGQGRADKLPGFVRDLLAAITPSSDSAIGVILVISLIPLAMFLRGLFSYLNIYLLCWVAIRAVNDLRVKLFQHIMHLPVSFFSQASTGDLMERINQISVLQNTITTSVAVIIRDPIAIISLMAVLLYQQTTLTLVTLVVFPLCLLPVIIYGRKLRNLGKSMQGNFSSLSSVMHESFTGHRIIKAYNLEGTVVDRYRTTIRGYISLYMRMVRATEIPGPLIEFFAAVGVALFFVYMKFMTQDKTAGDLLQFVGSIFLMYQPVKSLARLHGQLELARAASLQVFHLLDTQSTIVEPAHPKPLKAAGAEIQFNDIDFAYGKRLVLRNIQLTVKPGQLVALVGISGAGKTSLTNLLLRFYDPTRGTILIGGVDIRDVAAADLRSQIAVVTQETILFNDTIGNNIALGRSGATAAEIRAAAQHAHAHDFIMEKPLGYDTVVGEKGVNLSGGQRQRIAIARAILKNAPILILDEATNALDVESERAVQAALEDLMEGRTTICIAHRLSTIQRADLIVVMDQGRIVEKGRHSELMEARGVYYRLFSMQFEAVESE